MKRFIVAIDQGTTSSRAILFSLSGKPVYSSRKEFRQYFPKDGWVEHNPNEIWSTTKKVLKDVINKSKKLKGKILTIGITNQRETTILWDKKTGKPIYNAIVWQDRRTAEFCKKFKTNNKEKIINRKTGLLIDPYFSGTKIKWILDNVPKAKKLAKNNNLLFGTVDTFLLWKLTKGKLHATDATNASRTMLFNISTVMEVSRCLNQSMISKIVLDPVMFAKSGDRLLQDDAIESIRQDLFPLVTIATPNIPETEALLNSTIESPEQMEMAALDLCRLGPKAVVVKGGNLTTQNSDDCLGFRDGKIQWLKQKRINYSTNFSPDFFFIRFPKKTS